MLQCVMCQDWFHDHCIIKSIADTNTNINNTNELEEKKLAIYVEEPTDYVCKDCVLKYKFFITKYPHLIYQPKSETKIDVEANDATENFQSTACLIEGKPEGRVENIFFNFGWKGHLCRCKRCLDTYTYAGIPWIAEEEHEASEESQEEHKDPIKEEEGPVLDFVQQMQVHQGMSDLSNKLTAYLKGLTERDPNKVIAKRVCFILLNNELSNLLGHRRILRRIKGGDRKGQRC